MKKLTSVVSKPAWALVRIVCLAACLLPTRPSQATIAIDEFLAINDGLLQDEDSESPDWIELYNSGPTAVNLGGWHLTDEAGNLMKWTFPATNLPTGGYLVVFASGKDRSVAGRPLHANFQLADNSGYLALVQPDGATVASVFSDYPRQRANVSYGLNTSSALRYFSPPTPGTVNAAGYLGIVDDTKFSVDRGFYDTPFVVAIASATTNAVIYWTTNGSIPSPTNGTYYTGPIPVANTTTLRAAAYRGFYVPSVPDAQTYIFLRQVLKQPGTNGLPGYPTIWQASYPADYEMDSNVVNSVQYGPTISNDLRSIPSLSIVSTFDAFWNPNTGIYVDASRTTEVAGTVELFNGDNTSEFQVNCGIEMEGEASRDNVRLAKHSFNIKFKSDYGPSKLRYDWFSDPVHEFDTITLRAGFCDTWATRTVAGRYDPKDASYIRDTWVKDSVTDMGHLAAHGTFVHLYLNGLYWGVYNPCERCNASYFSHHLGGFDQDWDIMRDFGECASGSPNDWNNLIALVNAGVSSESAYQAVAAQVDIDNLIDYMLLHFLAEAEDWPAHNWYAAHRHANVTNGLPATQWIFLPWDQEIVLEPDNPRDRTGVSDDKTPARIYSQLRAWPEFRREFGDRVQKHLFNGGALTASNNTARLQRIAALIDRAVVGESARWGDAREFAISPNPGTGITFTRDEWWVPELNYLYTNWFPNLTGLTIGRLVAGGLYPALGAPQFSQFGGAISNGFALALSHTNVSGAILYTLDGSDPRVYGTGAVAPSAQTYAAPMILNATTTVRARVLGGGQWSALVEAVFFPPQNLDRLALTELMYHPPDVGSTNGDEFEFLELKNCGTNTLNLSGLNFSAGITFTFTNGTLLGPGRFFVLARNPSAFAAKYPGVPVNGLYTGKLDNNGEKVALATALGTPVFSVTYGDRSPWPVAPDLADFSLVPVHPEMSQAPDKGSAWRASTNPGGSPGADDPVPGIAPIVINELLTHTDLPQKDAVELFNPAATNVNVGGWYLTDDASTPRKFRIPDSTVIPAGGYLYFDEDDFNPTPGTGTSFAFDSTGDDAYLFSADAGGHLTGYNHGAVFGASFNGASFGRCVNSAGEEFYPRQLAVTLGLSNAGPKIGPVVINEIHYHPDANGDEFVELLNFSGSPVPLFDPVHPTNAWKLAGVGYTFPTHLTLDAHATLLVVATNPATFRAKYNVPTNVLVLGPFTGQFQDDGENIELQAPDNPNTDGSVPLVTVDAVRYNDKSPWPAGADGSGLSLQRLQPSGFGNEPLNWTAEAPTPGTLAGSGDSDGDGLPDAWEQANGTLVFVPDADVDLDGDGFSNWQEYLAGTLPNDPASALRIRQITAAVDHVVLQFLAASNHTYSVLYKSSLADPAWLKLLDCSSDPTERILNTTNFTSDVDVGFYRLVTPAQP